MSSDEDHHHHQQQQQLSWVGNIKEMARQVAALTRTSTYRHGPMPSKDLTYFGNNHSLQTTQLTLNGPLCSNDFSAFKTPPEGSTPVDVKHFDYGEETLKTVKMEPKNLQSQLIDLCNGHVTLNDSGISSKTSSDMDSEQIGKGFDEDVIKNEDDAYHTPPEFQDEQVSLPSEELITSVIDILSQHKNTTHTIETSSEDSETTQQQDCANSDQEKVSLCEERENSENDSLDSSPVGSRKFTQEEDDSGISTVDENDVSRDSRDSPTMTKDNSFKDRKKEKSTKKMTPENNYSPKLDRKPHVQSELRHQSYSPRMERKIASDAKQGKTYTKPDTDDNIGWQTRYRRTGKKQREFDRRFNHYNNQETYGQGERGNAQDFKWGTRDGKYREKSNEPDNQMYNSTGKEKPSDDYYTSKTNRSWSNKRQNEDIDTYEQMAGSSRQNLRGGVSSHAGGRQAENVWGKNGSKDMFVDTENKKEQFLGGNASVTTPPNVFSYRDALLKVSSSKDTSQTPITISKKNKIEFDVTSATNYLSSVWTSVKSLHKKDPSKVFIFSDD